MIWNYADDFFEHAVGGPSEGLWKAHEQAHGLGKINAVLSGLVSRTQYSYRGACAPCVRFGPDVN